RGQALPGRAAGAPARGAGSEAATGESRLGGQAGGSPGNRHRRNALRGRAGAPHEAALRHGSLAAMVAPRKKTTRMSAAAIERLRARVADAHRASLANPLWTA